VADDYCWCGSRLVECARCDGKGWVYIGFFHGEENPCKTCNGTGKLCPKHGNNYS